MKMISGRSLAASILGVAFAALPAWAAAPVPPELQIAVTGVGTVTIDSTGTPTYTNGCTAALCGGTVTFLTAGGLNSATFVGSMTWTGTIGNLNIAANGRTKPVLIAPDIDLQTNIATSATAGGTVTISWTDVGFTVGESPATMNIVPSGVGTAQYTSYVDGTNTPFGTGTEVGTTTGGGMVTGPGPAKDPFSMTNVEMMTLPAGVGGADPTYPAFSDDFGLMVAPHPPLSLTCGASTGQVGVPYSSLLVASGGVPAYTYSIASSILPLSLNAGTGAITGTPTTSGPLTFTAEVTDFSGDTGFNTATAACAITISPPAKTTYPPLKVTCPATTATVGQPYNSPVGVTGGSGNFTFSIVTGGSLPTGLTLNSTTGVISGTPQTGAQTGAFRTKVVDNVTGDVAYSNCSGSCVNGTSVSYGGQQPQSGWGQKGVSSVYTSNGVSLPVYGYSNSGHPTNLYSNNVEGNSALGLSNWSNQNQIDDGHFVQFDFSGHVGNGATGASFTVTSFDWNASFDIYGSNTQGSLGTLLVSNVSVNSWNSQCSGTTQTIPNFGNYKYICVRAHTGNCQVQTVTVNYPCSCAIDVSQAHGSWGQGESGNGWGNGQGGQGGNGWGNGQGGNSQGGQGGQNPGQCGW